MDNLEHIRQQARSDADNGVYNYQQFTNSLECLTYILAHEARIEELRRG